MKTMAVEDLTSATTGIATTAAGLSVYFDLIEQGLGIVAATLGIVLTSMTIYRRSKEWLKDRKEKRNKDG